VVKQLSNHFLGTIQDLVALDTDKVTTYLSQIRETNQALHAEHFMENL
jgi:hypothetical protein